MVDAANSEFYSANVTSLTTDFNVTPYYDDYDSNKNYYRILFKPGFAVQARELTQIQSILQNQVQTFGQHLFKEGSAVLGGKFNINTSVPYVKVKDEDSFSNEVTISKFTDQIVTGQTTGIKAYVNLVVDGVQTSQNTKTLYVTYMSANPDTGATVFVPNETLASNAGTLVVGSSTPTGTGSVFTINEGVRFFKEHFIHHNKQSIPIDRYGNSPTCQVGFIVNEDIIAAAQDSSLLDPALESSNFAAPGADRFRLLPELARYEVDDVVTPSDFVQLFTVRNGVVEELNERPAYNIIRDEIAKRTADESGDYYVRGFDAIIQEHLDLSDSSINNDGYLLLADGGDSSLLSVQVSPGTAYVKGYEVNKLTTSFLTTPKATNYANVNSQVISSSLGTYALVGESVGAWPLDFGYSVDLYNTAQQRISNGTFSSGQPSGNKIGTARIKSLSYETGTLGTASANLRLHLFDIQMTGANTFSTVRNIHYYNTVTGVNAAADIVTSSNIASIFDSTSSMIYPVGIPYVKTIRSSDGSIDTTFTYKKTENITIQTDGTFTISTAVGGSEIFGYGTSALSDADKREFFLTFTDSSFNVAITGTTSSSSTGTSLVGNVGIDFTKLSVGNAIQFSGNSATYIITAISSATSLTVNKNLPASMSGNTVYKAYKTGSMIDLTGVGLTGNEITVQGDSNSLTIDLKETFSATKTATITYPVIRTSAKEIAKDLRPNRFVKIHLGSSPYNTNLNGPFNLGISDVYKIRSIRRKNSDFTAAGQGTDVTTQFTFDNGQRDDYYGFASISPTNISSALTTSDYLLIELDYFLPNFTLGTGYFSVDSYPVDDISPGSTEITTSQIPVYVSPITGSFYDLKNCLDFRPVYLNTAADIQSGAVNGMSANPSSASTFITEASGLRIPADSEPVTFDYQYYLGRIDMLTIDKDGNFNIIQGVSSRTPRTPGVPDNVMSLAQLNIMPYPSISLSYSKLLNRSDLACVIRKIANVRYTMRDIGIIKSRVDNLENYVSLSLLEKDALDLKVLDGNGLDRFKNGIFTDSFANHSLGDYTNIDYKICVDPKEFSIRPLQEMQDLSYELMSNTNCSRIGNLVLLNYTEETLIDQPRATTFRNVETTVYRFIGKVYLEPETDFWMNTKRVTNLVVEVGDKQEITPLSVTEGNWELITGSFKVGKNIDKNVLSDPNLNFYNIGENQNNNQQKNVKNLPKGLPSNNDFNKFNILKNTYTAGNIPNKFKILKDDVYAEYQQKVTTTKESATTTTESLGDRVIDVSMIPDIRPQTIAFHATGLKASTRHYVYFDGVDMSAYVTPSSTDPEQLPDGLIPTGTDVSWPPADRKFNFKATGAKGSALYSNSDGNAYGLLTLPDDGSKTFRVGTKEIIVTDSPTNEPDATSAGKGTFVAQGLTQQKQGTILSTRKVTRQTKEEIKIEKVFFNDPSCMAYSFIPKAPDGEEGVFLTSVDVFFAAKDPNLGIWFEIREMDDASGITRTQVPFSEVWKKSSQITTSDDGTVATTITFPSPVFLLNNVPYAFVIHTEGINPNYYMWVSVLGENDVVTKKPVTSRGLTGSLFTTNNNLDWDIVPRVDLKIKFKRAKFNTNVTGEVVLGVEPKEFLSANGVSTAFTEMGELFYGNDRIFLSSTTYTPNVTDYIIGSNTSVNTSVLSITSGTYFMSNTGYSVGEPVTIRSNTGTVLGTAKVASKNTASGLLYSYTQKRTNTDVVFTSSSGKFYAGDMIRGNLSGQFATVQSVDKFVYSLSQFEPGYLNFQKTALTYQMQTTNNATGLVGTYDFVSPGIRNYYTNEKVIYSRSTTGKPSNNVKVSLVTSSEYLSPILDLGRTHTVFVHNIINSNTSGETASSGGGLKNKYISQIVTLAEGQDAEDAVIILTAYRPPTSNADIKVYMKISHAEDPDPISSRNWIEMEYIDDTYYSSLSDITDFREYSFKFPDSYLIGTIGGQANVVQYTTSTNATYVGFKQFQMKIALQSDDSAVVPRVADLRVIALQK